MLLNLIDHLPRDSYYAQAVADDEEHAALMLARQELNGGSKATEQAPPLATWSAEAGMLADLIDSVNALRHTLIAVNSKKGANNKLTPYPRPRTAIDKVRRRSRQAKHEALVARVLPMRRKED